MGDLKKYQTDGVKKPWGGYASRFEMLQAKKAEKEAATVTSDDRDHYNTRGNFRYSTEMDVDYSQNIRSEGRAKADSGMIAKYAATVADEESQFGDDKHGMTPKERAAYNKKYASTVDASAGRTKWSFNQAFSAARGAGKKDFQMLKDGKWETFTTRRADETVDQFNNSFIMNTPEQVARNQEVTGRKRIAYGPGDPLSNIDRLNTNKKARGGFLEPPTEYI